MIVRRDRFVCLSHEKFIDLTNDQYFDASRDPNLIQWKIVICCEDVGIGWSSFGIVDCRYDRGRSFRLLRNEESIQEWLVERCWKKKKQQRFLMV